ncbi:MAG: hypothetical protein Q4C37_07975 [Bacteroidales bacterium]|nr:hypothetical protein [Bacteroidales bacterium]
MKDEQFKYQYAGVCTMLVATFIFSRIIVKPWASLWMKSILALIMIASAAFLTWNFYKINNRKLFHRFIFVSVIILGMILLGFLYTPPVFF